MIRITLCVAVLVVCASRSVGGERWLLVTGSATVHSGTGDPNAGDFADAAMGRRGLVFRALLDTEAPPELVQPSGAVYPIADFELLVVGLSPGDTSVVRLTPEGALGALSWDAAFARVRLVISANDASQLVFNLVISEPAGNFEDSIPGDPLAFDTTPATIDVRAILGSVDFSGNALWEPGAGATLGSVAYMVSPAHAPTPDPCSEADLAEPYGILDFDDVLAYLVAFGVGCP